MYPDVSLSVLTQAFSYALLDNKKEVELIDVYNAIKNSKRIYPDSIVKELKAFKEKFSTLCQKENISLPDVSIDEISSNTIKKLFYFRNYNCLINLYCFVYK